MSGGAVLFGRGRRVGPAGSLALTGLGAAVLGLAIGALWLVMRDVMDIGGFCAQGGPFVIENPCPEGTVWMAPTSIFVGFAGAGLMMYGLAGVPRAPVSLVLVAWPALFLALAWNFIEYGFRPAEGDGPVWGWLVPGVMFVLVLALPGLALLRGIVRRMEPPRLPVFGAIAAGAAVGVMLALLVHSAAG